jgi:hypothetical protein
MEWDLHLVSQTKKYRTRVPKEPPLDQEEGSEKSGATLVD